LIGDQAQDELENLFAFWIEVHGLSDAIRFRAYLDEKLVFLSQNPFSGSIISRKPVETRRWVVHPTYCIIHEWYPAAELVKVLSFWDNRQDPTWMRV